METEQVHLYVYSTLSDWEPAFAISALNNSIFPSAKSRCQVHTVALTREPIKTTGGLTVLPDMTLDEFDPLQSALLILPGGAGWPQGEHGDILEKAKQMLAANRPVAAICGAVVGLARAGILDKHRHTGNWIGELQAVNDYRGESLYQDQPAVTDGNLITASATAPLEFAYEILQKLQFYNRTAIDAWYGLYSTHKPEYFFALQQAMAQEAI